MYDVISNVIIYTCLPVMLAGSFIMLVLLPFEIKRAIDESQHAEPPRRRATDVKPGTSE